MVCVLPRPFTCDVFARSLSSEQLVVVGYCEFVILEQLAVEGVLVGGVFV